MLKRYFLAFLLTLSLFGCCAQTPPNNPTTTVNKLEYETVALVSEDGDVFCSGVWVGEQYILTAAHCVRNSDDEDNSTLHYTTLQDSNGPFNTPAVIRDSRLYKTDRTHDLALLRVEAPPPHLVAPVGLYSPPVGAELHFVGHPDGFEWSYSHGYVAAYRKADLLPADRRQFGPWLQVAANLWYGNSGGGAFDSYGNLVGICSFKIKANRYTPVEGMNFFVHLETIKAFLN